VETARRRRGDHVEARAGIMGNTALGNIVLLNELKGGQPVGVSLAIQALPWD
jgi:hypothetical protein